jgi:hypothetical protein
MVEVTLSDISLGGKGNGLGVCNFEVLPRAGDIVVMSVEDQGQTKARYEVVHLEHIVFDRSKRPGIFMVVRQEGCDRAFRGEDIDALFTDAPE